MVSFSMCDECRDLFEDYGRYGFKGGEFCSVDCRQAFVQRYNVDIENGTSETRHDSFENYSDTSSDDRLSNALIAESRVRQFEDEQADLFRYSAKNLRRYARSIHLIDNLYNFPTDGMTQRMLQLYNDTLEAGPRDMRYARHHARLLNRKLLRGKDEKNASEFLNSTEYEWIEKPFELLRNELSLGSKAAAKCIIEEAKRGIHQASRLVGSIYTGGHFGFKKDPIRGLEYFELAADQGSSVGANFAGREYRDGVLVPKNPKKEVKYYMLAAELGQIEALVAMSLNFKFGNGVNKSPIRAAIWAVRAAERANMVGERLFASYCYHAMGVEYSPLRGMYWYKRAAKQGDEKAKEILATGGVYNYD